MNKRKNTKGNTLTEKGGERDLQKDFNRTF